MKSFGPYTGFRAFDISWTPMYHQPMKKIKLTMFDFDGTLVDTAPDIITTTNLLLTKYEKPTLSAQAIRDEIGTGLGRLVEDVFPESKEDRSYHQSLIEEFISIYNERMLDTPSLFPGALEFLTTRAPSAGQKIAIVSNKREAMIHKILGHLGLTHLPWVDIIGGDTLKSMKPDPAPFRRAIEKAGVDVTEAVIIGDGTPDIVGAANTGCFSIAVDFGYGAISELMSLGAHAKLSNYSMLPKVLQELKY